MKIELLVFGVTAFFIANTYYEGKYINMLIKQRTGTHETVLKIDGKT